MYLFSLRKSKNKTENDKLFIQKQLLYLMLLLNNLNKHIKNQFVRALRFQLQNSPARWVGRSIYRLNAFLPVKVPGMQ